MFRFLNELIAVFSACFIKHRSTKPIRSLVHSVWHSLHASQLVTILKSLFEAAQIQSQSSQIEMPGSQPVSLWGRLFTPKLDSEHLWTRENHFLTGLSLILFQQEWIPAHNTAKTCSPPRFDSHELRIQTNTSAFHFRHRETSAYRASDQSSFDQIDSSMR